MANGQHGKLPEILFEDRAAQSEILYSTRTCTHTIFVEKLVPSSPFQTTSRALSADDVFFLTVSGAILSNEKRHRGVGINYSDYGDVICDGPGPTSSYSARGPFASKYLRVEISNPR